MTARSNVAEYLRLLEMEEPDSASEALLNSDSYDVDEIDLSDNVPPTKAFHGEIRVKSDKSDSTEDSTEFDEEIFAYQQFDRRNTIEDDMVPFESHPCLSPTKPTAKLLVFLINAIDFSFGTFLIARACLQMRDEYGNLIVSLILGVLLLSGSIAGILLHAPISDVIENRSLTIFNIAFGFIIFAIYYVLSLLLLTSMATMASFVGTELGLAGQFALCLTGFALSVGEVYKIMYIQYHYFSGQRSSSNVQNSSATVMIDDADDVENANAIPSILSNRSITVPNARILFV